jgi:HSP20 family molecular chaperone IbpA
VECKGAKLEDGMLKVELNYNPPEDKKPKKIAIK